MNHSTQYPFSTNLKKNMRFSRKKNKTCLVPSLLLSCTFFLMLYRLRFMCKLSHMWWDLPTYTKSCCEGRGDRREGRCDWYGVGVTSVGLSFGVVTSFTTSSSTSFFTPPPPTFLAVRTLLVRLRGGIVNTNDVIEDRRNERCHVTLQKKIKKK